MFKLHAFNNHKKYQITISFFYFQSLSRKVHIVYTQGAKSLYLAKKGLEVTSPAIVVLNAFLDSSDLPKEGLSGLLWKFFWRDALIRRYLDVLFVINS